MLKKITFGNLVLFSLLFVCITPQNAYAYLDPGSGSFLIQLLLAGIFGVVFAVKMFWRKIAVFFKKLFTRKNNGKK